MASGPYARVYQSIVDDPMFEKVYNNDHALAQWLRMLLIADAMYPTSAPMPPRNPTVRLLIGAGLVVEKPGNRYSMRGLSAERERRSEIGRNAAAVRYQKSSTANAMPNRTEHNKAEQGNGQSPAIPSADTFMGWKPRTRISPSDVERQHQRDFDPCAQCGQRRGGAAHAPVRATHSFQESEGTR